MQETSVLKGGSRESVVGPAAPEPGPGSTPLFSVAGGPVKSGRTRGQTPGWVSAWLPSARDAARWVCEEQPQVSFLSAESERLS